MSDHDSPAPTSKPTSDADTSGTWSVAKDPDDKADTDLECVLIGHEDTVRCVAFSPVDDKLLASASNDCTARIWDLKTKSCKFVLVGHMQWVTAVAFSWEGSVLATASNDMDVRLWDVATGNLIGILHGYDSDEPDATQGHNDSVTCVSFEPSGLRLIATGSVDGTVKIWNFLTRRVVRTFRPQPEAWITGVAFDDMVDMKVYASSDAPGQPVTVWDLHTGRQGLEFEADHGSFVRRRRLVFAGTTWDPRVEQCIEDAKRKHPDLTAFAAADNQQVVAVARADRSIELII